MEIQSYISNAHPEYIDNLYKAYQDNPKSVDTYWQKFFEGFDFAYTQNGNGNGSTVARPAPTNAFSEEIKVFNLIQEYRDKGHYIAKTNPIRPRKDRNIRLDISDFGLTTEQLNQPFAIGNILGLGNNASLQQILEHLQKIYCGSIGIEYGYITEPAEIEWLQNKFEHQAFKGYGFANEDKKHILKKLNNAVAFEAFLGKKYVGQKRFSLEGGDTAIPALDQIINTALDMGVKEVVLGMAHRGRLSVLANTMHKPYEQIFSEFEGKAKDPKIISDGSYASGDVKYHLGYASTHTSPNGNTALLSLIPNPSHLEAVNPVVQGYVRAKIDTIYQNPTAVLPITIHGDAAIAGQGIVYELAQMAYLPGYQVAGTVHFVINNQIGFTTDFGDARSSNYCTSVASIIGAPVFHVNGDDVEAVIYIAKIAAEYRQTFRKDVFIDMVCYRKHGHNESDDPSYTQPGMYEKIKNHPNALAIYTEQLVKEREITPELAQQYYDDFWNYLESRLDLSRQQEINVPPPKSDEEWLTLRTAERSDFLLSPATGISRDEVNTIREGLVHLPEGFVPLRKIQKYLEERRKMMNDNKSLDWAAAELMAYASLLVEGFNVRLSGEDVKRGTFTHRHAMVYDENTYAEYNRLSQITPDQGKFNAYNSLLSEYAVLGFEFGYSLATPNTLVIWEAQFGDFSNGAQIIIDQFIASSETKWQRNSGLTMLLPHGYEGQGPEHSSARLERYLQLCAQKNIQVVNITTPANFFHALRRQQYRDFRKPLIVMSPKSLLRDPRCISSIFDIIGEEVRFREFIDDDFVPNKKQVRKLLLCSGKVYYDLAEKQRRENITDVAILRVEQLYPLVYPQLDKILEEYPSDVRILWVQEEPANMGAWWHILARLDYLKLELVARKTAASPATGYAAQHISEQKDIVERAFA